MKKICPKMHNLWGIHSPLFTHVRRSANRALLLLATVHSCHTHPGGAVALDLFFKGNIKLRVISVYLSSTDIYRRNQTQNAVINWILQAQQSNLHSIILGDFNTQDNIYSPHQNLNLSTFYITLICLILAHT